MYDGPDFDYDILDVVHLLRLHKRRGITMTAPSAVIPKGDLTSIRQKNVFRCNRCDISGGMLKLYAELHHVTLSEANREIREALNKGEYRQVASSKGTGRKGRTCAVKAGVVG